MPRTRRRAYSAQQRMLARQAHLWLVVDGQHHLRAPGVLQRLRASIPRWPFAPMHGPQDQCALPRGALPLPSPPERGTGELFITGQAFRICSKDSKAGAHSDDARRAQAGGQESWGPKVATAHLDLVYNHRLVCKVHDGLRDSERQGPKPRAETAHQYQGLHGAWFCCSLGAGCSQNNCLVHKCMQRKRGLRNKF